MYLNFILRSTSKFSTSKLQIVPQNKVPKKQEQAVPDHLFGLYHISILCRYFCLLRQILKKTDRFPGVADLPDRLLRVNLESHTYFEVLNLN